MPASQENRSDAPSNNVLTGSAQPQEHTSDCALHNEPAYPAGPCDCGAAKHTPGPWVAEGSGVVGFGAPVIASGPGSHVAWLTRGLPGDGWPDARLIAAAPELLEALKAVTGWLDNGGVADVEMVLATARAAIRKATGADQ